jgi:hypothetical protein
MPKSAGIIRQIKDRLVLLGERSGVTPGKADDVAEHLYATAYATATRQKDRYLTRADLLRLFHERTQVSLPAATANALLAAIPRHLVPAGPLPVAVGGKSRAVVCRASPITPERWFLSTIRCSSRQRWQIDHRVLHRRRRVGVGSIREYREPPYDMERVVQVRMAHMVRDDIDLKPPGTPWEIKTICERGGHLLSKAIALPQRLSLLWLCQLRELSIRLSRALYF